MTEKVDVVVIGGGILGVATAFELAALDRSVILLEGSRLASGTTGASFAWLNATAKADDAHYHRLNAAGLQRHLELAARWGERPAGLAGAGSLHWSHPGADDGGPEEVLARATTLADWNYPVVPLERRELAALEPYIDFPEGSAGFLAPRDRWLDAPAFVRRMADEAAMQGADIRESAAVTEFVFEGDRVIGVEAPPFRIIAQHVVVTAGTALPSLVALARRSLKRTLSFQAVPGLLVDTEPQEREWLRHVVYFPDGAGFHMRPAGRGALSLGADDIDARHGRESADLTVGVTALLQRASVFMPGFPALRLVAGVHSRIGVRPMPGDGLPIVGPLPDVPDVYVAATHSGITLGPYLGQLIAREIALGESADELAPYRPARFED